MSVCLYASHLISGHTPCFECVHASVSEFMSTCPPMIAQPPMDDSYIETRVHLCGSVCGSQSPCFWPLTMARMCTCINTWIYVHLTAHICSTPTHSYMETWVPLCGSVFLSQSPDFCSHTLFRMCTCIRTWFVSTQLHMLGQPPLDSYMKTSVPLCGSLCVSQSSCLWSHTLIKMCTCISTCILVNVTIHVCFIPPLNSYMESWVALCGSVAVSQSPHFCSHTLVRMSVCISTCIHVHLTPTDCSAPFE